MINVCEFTIMWHKQRIQRCTPRRASVSLSCTTVRASLCGGYGREFPRWRWWRWCWWWRSKRTSVQLCGDNLTQQVLEWNTNISNSCFETLKISNRITPEKYTFCHLHSPIQEIKYVLTFMTSLSEVQLPKEGIGSILAEWHLYTFIKQNFYIEFFFFPFKMIISLKIYVWLSYMK